MWQLAGVGYYTLNFTQRSAQREHLLVGTPISVSIESSNEKDAITFIGGKDKTYTIRIEGTPTSGYSGSALVFLKVYGPENTRSTLYNTIHIIETLWDTHV